MKQLSGQPFLVVQFFQKPREEVDTRVKGWMSDPKNLVNLERAFVVDRVTSKDITSPVIINLATGDAVNNSVGKPDDELVAHYVEKYADMIKDSLTAWVKKEVLGKQYGKLGK